MHDGCMAKSASEKGTVRKRTRRSAAEWRDEVAAWKASGQGAREYATEHDLHPGTLLWWSSRGKTGGKWRKPARAGAAVVARNSSFLPVRVRRAKGARSAGGGLLAEIVLTGGRRVRLLGEVPLDKLGHLLDVIEGSRSC